MQKAPLVLDFHNLPNPVSDPQALAQQLLPILADAPYACIIRDFPVEPHHRSLLRLTYALGQPLLEEHNLDGGPICLVQAEKSEGFVPYANTPYEFPCHTDCSDFNYPPNAVILQCEKQAPEGGESYLVSVADVVAKLSPEQRDYFSQPLFLFREQLWPVLGQQSDGRWVMRYNRMMNELSRRLADLPLSPSDQALDQLEALISEQKTSFYLQPGDCLIFHNHTLLHGRNAFQDTGERLLKRIRLNLDYSQLNESITSEILA